MTDAASERKRAAKHIVLTSHPTRNGARPLAVDWGAAEPSARGPIVGSLTDRKRRNVIGAHAGSYALYRALAIAAGSLDPMHKPDLTDTSPPVAIGPYPQWSEPGKIVSLDPFGHRVGEDFASLLAAGWDIRPTIAVTRARLTVPELKEAIAAGRLARDGRTCSRAGRSTSPRWRSSRCGICPGLPSAAACPSRACAAASSRRRAGCSPSS